MSLFVEVYDVKKECPVVVNLDHVVEITPLRSGGCEICFNDGAAVSGKRVVNVKEDFGMFRQLVMHMVTPESMSDRIAKIKLDASVLDTPKPEAPKKTVKKAALDATYDIPKL